MNPPILSDAKGEPRPGARIWYVLAALVVLAVMGRTAGHEFVDWDDRFLLAGNPKFNPPTWQSVLGYVLPRNLDENLYIPATQLFWGFLAAIGHTDHPDSTGTFLNPWVFHCANLALHIGSVWVVFAILRSFVADGPAWSGALIFAIHPVQVETVAWASGLRDLLSALFGFICIYQLIQFRLTRRRGRWIIATVMIALAMLSKPSAVAMPLAAMVVDIILLRTPLRRSLAGLSPWFFLAIPIVLITRQAQPMLWPVNVPLIARPLIALDTIAFYITKIIAPIHLVFDYGRRPQSVLDHGWQIIWILPLLLLLLLIWVGNRRPTLTAGCLLALAGIVPVLGIVSFAAQDYSTVSDHYLYPSMLGIALVFASLVEASLKRIPTAVVYGLALAITGAMAAESIALTNVWSNSYSLFTYALSVNPRSSNANAGLGFSLAAGGDMPGAKEHFQIAVQLNPHNGMAIMGLANTLLREGDLDGAATQYEQLMQVYQMQSNFDPKLAASVEMVIATQLIGRGDNAGARAAIQQARQWDPLNPQIAEMIGRASTTTYPVTNPHAAP